MSNVRGRPYVLISCDAHAGASILDYKPYLEREYHDEFEAWAAAWEMDPWARFDTEMLDTDDSNLRMGGASFGSIYNWDNEKRLEHLDADGIAAEVIFPNTVPPFFPRAVLAAPGPATAEEYRHRWAGLKAHNRWLVDFCQAAPGRRAGLAQLFLDDIDDAIAEVHWAREHGLMGVLIPSDHWSRLVPLYERRLDPLWDACVENNMPVHRHGAFVGGSTDALDVDGVAADTLGMYEAITFNKRGLAHLILGGVFDRHPGLKFVFAETPVSWAKPELDTLENVCRLARIRGTNLHATVGRGVAALTKDPTDYFNEGVWIGASLIKRSEVLARDDIGIDRILWGSDYPHHEGSWPRTRITLRHLFWDIPEDEVRQMTSENSAAVYGFDLDFLQGIADEIGPTPADLAVPVRPEELPRITMSSSLTEALDLEALQEA